MIGTDHGRADSCLMFADTNLAQGRVPVAATGTPVRTARSAMGMPSQSLSIVIVSLSSSSGSCRLTPSISRRVDVEALSNKVI